MPLTGADYIELLPAETRVINSYGVKIRHRIYDAKELNPYRGQDSGIKALKNLWEIHYDPYDITRVWIRNHHNGGWITAYWRHLNAAPQPFGEVIWERGRQIVAGRGVTSPSQETIGAAVEELLEPRRHRKNAGSRPKTKEPLPGSPPLPHPAGPARRRSQLPKTTRTRLRTSMTLPTIRTMPRTLQKSSR